MEDLSSWKENFEVCVYAKKLLDVVEHLNTQVKDPIDIEEIKKGIYYARKYHGSQMRQSGDPYYSHPIEVSIMLAEFTAVEAPKLYTSIMLQAALLHDTIEDTELTEEIIAQVFGLEVARHVEGLTRIKPYGKISAEKSLNLLIKQKRYNTALIKLFDRIHNIQTLGAKSPEKVLKILRETLVSFLHVCIYLEIHAIEYKLTKLCWDVFKQQTKLTTLELKKQIFNSNNYAELFQVIQNESLPNKRLFQLVS